MTQSTWGSIKGSRTLTIGVLVAALMAASMLLAAKPAHASTTFTVTNANDSGPGSLRQAIVDANNATGADVIDFAIPAGQDPTIAPTSQLPTITHPVTINGYSQPGAEPNSRAVGSNAVLKIVLSGSKYPSGDGLVLGASNSTVKGLVVNGWLQGIHIDGSDATGNRISGNFIGTDASGTQSVSNNVGVRFQHGSNNTVGGTTAAQRNVISGNRFSGVSIGDGDFVEGNQVAGNYIGTDKSGTEDLGNGSYGVNIDDAPNNTVGGTTAAERNVISGNDKNGLMIYTRGTKVTGNFIGTDVSGTKALGNGSDGVQINFRNNTIGGTTAGERNVISGNTSDGVFIVGGDSTGNRIVGNYVGTDASGTKDVGNGDNGVYIDNAANNTLGGTTVGTRNVISGNDGDGVQIFGTDAKGNRVIGNYLGTDRNGTADLGNGYYGVLILSAPNNSVGGTQAGERNVISGNGDDGVEIYGDGATGDRVLSNSIFANAGIGIDLNGTNDPTPNDSGDMDTGPNNLQNFPVLTSAKKSASGTTTIKGMLNSTPSTSFKVQLFANPEGGEEGKTLLGSGSVSTGGSGDVSFAFSTKKAIRLGQNITATATGPGGNTSEFSAPKKVVAS